MYYFVGYVVSYDLHGFPTPLEDHHYIRYIRYIPMPIRVCALYAPS